MDLFGFPDEESAALDQNYCGAIGIGFSISSVLVLMYHAFKYQRFLRHIRKTKGVKKKAVDGDRNAFGDVPVNPNSEAFKKKANPEFTMKETKIGEVTRMAINKSALQRFKDPLRQMGKRKTWEPTRGTSEMWHGYTYEGSQKLTLGPYHEHHKEARFMRSDDVEGATGRKSMSDLSLR